MRWVKEFSDFLSPLPNGFGLDISDRSVKWAQLARQGKHYRLAGFGEQEMKKGIVEKGKVKDPDALGKVLRAGLEEQKDTSNFVVASLPEEQVYVRPVQLPRALKKEEVREAAYWAAEANIPISIEEAYFDYNIIPPLRDGLDHYDVLVAAALREVIAGYQEAFDQAGLFPLALEPESAALSRALIKNQVSPYPLVIADIGATRTRLTVYYGNSMRLTTSLPFTAVQMTRAVVKVLKVKGKEAEQLKREVGLNKKIRKGAVYEALVPVLSDLAEQIHKYILYSEEQVQHRHGAGKKMGRVLLVGGGSRIPGIEKYFSTTLGLPVELGNPWVNILESSLRSAPGLPFIQSIRYATALGLALRAVNFSDYYDFA